MSCASVYRLEISTTFGLSMTLVGFAEAPLDLGGWRRHGGGSPKAP